MKKIIYFCCLSLLFGCEVHVPLYIHNNSDENLLVYRGCGDIDSLLPISGYTILRNRGVDSIPQFFNVGFSTDIGANMKGSDFVAYKNSKTPHLRCKEKKTTLFFITERTILDYDWDEIYKQQLFVHRVTLTEEELIEMNWEYVYNPAGAGLRPVPKKQSKEK